MAFAQNLRFMKQLKTTDDPIFLLFCSIRYVQAQFCFQLCSMMVFFCFVVIKNDFVLPIARVSVGAVSFFLEAHTAVCAIRAHAVCVGERNKVLPRADLSPHSPRQNAWWPPTAGPYHSDVWKFLCAVTGPVSSGHS